MNGESALFCRCWLGRWSAVLTLTVGVLVCQAQPLFPTNCTVILLAGLPGDVESERAYTEQLQSWVDLASTTPGPRQIFALADVPDAIRLPPGERVAALKNDRKTFLTLAEKLSGSTNPLVVIAWGHGGRQRDIPVFHVRGPRLTPEDFSLLAAKVPDSLWVLVFRASGGFARRLAGPHTRVLSSDTGQSFNSDPVAMPLLLKLARDNSAKSFDKLARELGRATAAWYQERSLARTEDPALWTREDNPELLAAAVPPSEQPGEKVPGEARIAEAAPQTGRTGEMDDSQRKLEPGGGWSTIRKVRADDFAEYEAVVLRHSLICSLGRSPALTTEQEEYIQVLTPEGKTKGDFDISFAPPDEEIEFQDCEVLRPDGELVRLDADRIGESREQPLGDYQGQRRKFFSLPGVVPGAVIHVRYRTQWKQFPLPQISMALPLGKEIPMLHSTVEISLPKESAFHWAFEQMPASDPSVRQTSYGATYTWVFTNVPPHSREVLSPPLQQPRLLFSTFRDWRDFAGWYERISRLTGELTPEMEAKAKSLTMECRTDREKLIALYNYVAALRYVAVPLGINSVRPHAAASVLRNQFGDCKDKANLLNAMLGSLNIEAHLVLVPRFSQAHDMVPGLSFNHAISRVTLGSEHVWLDTTDDVCRFGMLPPGDYGRKVLVIDEKTRTLEQLPAADPKDHRLHIHSTMQWPKQGSSLPSKLKVVGHGYPDYDLRATAREARETHAALPLISAKFRPVSGAFALNQQKSTAISALDEDFCWEAAGEYIGVIGTSAALPATPGPWSSGALRFPFWVPKEWDLALHQRRSALFLNQGYPLTLEQRFEAELPAKAGSVKLPQRSGNGQGPLRWSVTWARIGDDKVEAQFKAELLVGELAPEQSPGFQQQVREILDAITAEVHLTWPRNL